MGNFNRGGGDFRGGRGGRPDFGGQRRDRGFGGGGFRRPEMHKATCSECGNSCEVPFRPTGDKPVYCNDCFQGKGGESFREKSPRRDFRDNHGKSDFNKNDRGNGQDANQITKKIEELNSKIDRLTEMVKSISFNSKNGQNTQSSSTLKELVESSVSKKEGGESPKAKTSKKKPASKKSK